MLRFLDNKRPNGLVTEGEESAGRGTEMLMCPDCGKGEAFDLYGVVVTTDEYGNVISHAHNVLEDPDVFDEEIVCVCLECGHRAGLTDFRMNEEKPC